MTVTFNTTSFYSQNSQFKPKSSSLGRKILEVFLKIVCNFWRTLGSYFQAVPLSKETKEQLENLKEESYHDNGGLAIKELKHKRTVGPATVGRVLNHSLLKKYPNIHVVGNFMSNSSSPDLPEREENKQFVLVPVVMKGLIRDHIVAVLYDVKNNRVELYDPKGLTSKDRSGSVRCGTDLNLSDVLARVADTYGNGKTTLWENTKVNQRDSHNCGIQVLDYFERRLGGESPEEIAKDGLTFSAANNAKREHYLKQIIV